MKLKYHGTPQKCNDLWSNSASFKYNSYHRFAEGPRDATRYIRSNRVTAAQLSEKSHLKRLAIGESLWRKVTQGRRKCRYSIDQMSLPVSGLYIAPFPIHYYMYSVQCTWQRVIFRSISVSTGQFRLQAPCMCFPIHA